MSEAAPAFRRRCGWCGRQLRAWQMNTCRQCRARINDPWASAPCGQGQNWDAEPDYITPARESQS